MMKAPSIKRLLEHFPELNRGMASRVRTLHKITELPWDEFIDTMERLGYDMPHLRSFPGSWGSYFTDHIARRQIARKKIAEIFNATCEALGQIDMYDGPRYEYINLGDPWTATLIFDNHTGTMSIGMWGELVASGKVFDER